MNELTLQGFLRLMSSYFAEHSAKWMILWIEVEGQKEPEMIINPRANFQEKAAYVAEAYDENLHLKANPSIRIVHYDLVEELIDLEAFYGEV